MKFFSTRGNDVAQNAATAITKGLAKDGGLFVPEYFPDFSEKIKDMVGCNYAQIATEVIGSYLEEYDKEQLLVACEKAYSLFEENEPAPVVRVEDNLFITELFHGPTLAFKDIALTLLPFLMRKGADICGIKDEILILVATSGDTGKAALEGFKNADGIKIMVFYPSEGVSDMQKLQMQTQEGNNVNVVAVKGNFDDCQTAVKKIFSSLQIAKDLKEKGVVLSSANSINFGRLVPQIAYYFSSYCDLVDSEQIKLGDKINFVVPTGNFGNILAAYYAKQMGLPIDKLVCASNSNNVLTEFFADGTYDVNREFFKTKSPSMDILISSNLERLVFELSNRDAVLTEQRMNQLKKEGKYSISEKEKLIAEQNFYADFCDEEECTDTIGRFFEYSGYVLDTHTAVAMNVYESFISWTGNKNATVVISTASPYKFASDVLQALNGKKIEDAFKAAAKIEEESALPIPEQIKQLKQKERKFKTVISREEVAEKVLNFAKN